MPVRTLNRSTFQITVAMRKEIEKIVDARLRTVQVTREDFTDLKNIVGELALAQKELAEAQKRTEQRVEELAEAQKRTEQRVEELAEAQKRTEQRVEELAEAQKRTEQRLDRLEAIVQELAEAQKRTEQRVEELAEAQKRTEQRVEQLTIAQERMTEEIISLARRLTKVEDRLGRMIGRDLEREYREKAYAYLGQLLRDIRAVSLQDLEADLESRLSVAELDDLRLLDVLLRGKPRQPTAVPEIWLALEVSAVVDRSDVERAQRRASLLRKAGLRAVPAVAGEELTQGGEEAARTERVLMLQDGKRHFWAEALEHALAD